MPPKEDAFFCAIIVLSYMIFYEKELFNCSFMALQLKTAMESMVIADGYFSK